MIIIYIYILIYYLCAHQQAQVEGYAQRSEEALSHITQRTTSIAGDSWRLAEDAEGLPASSLELRNDVGGIYPPGRTSCSHLWGCHLIHCPVPMAAARPVKLLQLILQPRVYQLIPILAVRADWK